MCGSGLGCIPLDWLRINKDALIQEAGDRSGLYHVYPAQDMHAVLHEDVLETHADYVLLETNEVFDDSMREHLRTEVRYRCRHCKNCGNGLVGVKVVIDRVTGIGRMWYEGNHGKLEPRKIHDHRPQSSE